MITKTPSIQFFTDDIFGILKKNISQEKETSIRGTFQKVLEVFTIPNISHPFIKNNPQICQKITKLMNGRLEYKITKLVLQQFIINGVFTKEIYEEKVKISCRENHFVYINKSVWQILTNSYKKLQKQEDGCYYIDYSKNFSKDTMICVKEFFYTNHVNPHIPSSILCELYHFSYMYQEERLREVCLEKLREIARQINFKEACAQFITDIEDIKLHQDKIYADLVQTALFSYLRSQNLPFFLDESRKCLLLSPGEYQYLQDTDILSKTIQNYTVGLYISQRQEVESLLLFCCMPQEIINKIQTIRILCYPPENIINQILQSFTAIKEIIVHIPLIADTKQINYYIFKNICNEIKNCQNIPLRFSTDFTEDGIAHVNLVLDRKEMIEELKALPIVYNDNDYEKFYITIYNSLQNVTDGEKEQIRNFDVFKNIPVTIKAAQGCNVNLIPWTNQFLMYTGWQANPFFNEKINNKEEKISIIRISNT